MKNIKKNLKNAEKAVENIKDPELKKIAFQAILDRTLSAEQVKTVGVKEQKPGDKKTKLKKDLLKEIANKTKIPFEDISQIIEKDDGDYSFFIKVDDDGSNENKLKFLILILTVNYFLTDNTKMDSSTIRKKLIFRGFTKIGNLSTIVKNIQNYVRRNRGPIGSTKTSYSISKLGIGCGIKILKCLATGSKLDDINIGVELVKPSKKGKRGVLTKAILNEIEKGFFDNPKSVKDLKKQLEKEVGFFKRGIIDEKMRRRFKGKELTRIKKDKKWYYVKKGG